jgi:hypothetical protein
VVDNGYIVYTESSEDADADKAKFKAEAAGLEDLANECSFIPKEARVEDRFERKVEHMHQAYAKVAIEFQVCDQARKATTPEAVRNMANVPMTEEVKRYQDLLGKADVGDVDEASDDHVAENAPSAPSSGSTHVAMNDQVYIHYYVAQEQVWQYKQEVIMAPPAAYPPGSPQSTQFTNMVVARNEQIQTMQTTHPELVSPAKPYSSYRTQIVRNYGAVGRPHDRSKQNRRAPNQPKENHPIEKQQPQKRHRRHREEGG